jgi:hypothetical protein
MQDPQQIEQADVLGEAETQYNDWRGTVALDVPVDHEALALLAGLDPDEWFIIGLRIGGDRLEMVSIYAIPRSLLAERGAIAAFAARHGGRIPVTEHEIDVSEAGTRLLANVFERCSIVARRVSDSYDLAIVERRSASSPPGT